MRELSLNVMDVVQNSISAGASLIEIGEAYTHDGDRLEISIRDNGRGMSAAQVQSVIDPFYTTRTTRSVGLGVPLFKMACEQTGGGFTIDSTEGAGTTVAAAFITSHIDMTPVGDMAETIVLLISCNPDIDFVYSKTGSGADIALDTREMREILGEDVRLDSPDVGEWLRGYLAQTED